MQISKNLYYIGSQDPDRLEFDVYLRDLPRGVSYNSYFIKDKRNCIIDLVRDTPNDIKNLMNNIDTVLPKNETVDFLIVNHTEPDHSGAFSHIINRFPKITVVASQMAITLLHEAHNGVKFDSIEINDENQIVILGETTLKFHLQPMIHWPDTMISYTSRSSPVSVAFTCDLFGNFLTVPDNPPLISKLSSDDMEFYSEFIKAYFQFIMSPFKAAARAATLFVRDMKPKLICTSHGPVLDTEESIQNVFNNYLEWCKPFLQPKERLLTIVYATAHTFTGRIARIIVETIRKLDPSLNIETFDLIENENIKLAIESINRSSAFLVGSPTILKDATGPIFSILANMDPVRVQENAKVCGAFGSYGWSGEAVINLSLRMAELGLPIVPPLRVRFNPDGSSEKEDTIKQFALRFYEAMNSNSEFEPAFNKKLSKAMLNVREVLLETQERDDMELDPINEDIEYIDDGVLRLWKCIICGEVVKAVSPPIDPCPVCGAVDVWVCLGEVDTTNMMTIASNTIESSTYTDFSQEAEPEELGSDKRIVIIGASAAGIAAARAIREKNQEVKIVVISKDPFFPYYRPLLSKISGSKVKEDELFLVPRDFFSLAKINLLLNAKVISIDKKRQKIKFEQSEDLKTLTTHGIDRDTFFWHHEYIQYHKEKKYRSFSYDRLIIATGAHQVFNRRQLLGGSSKAIVDDEKSLKLMNVFSFRNWLDLREIIEYATRLKKSQKMNLRGKGKSAEKTSVLLVGGGPLSLELSDTLRSMGFTKITVVENHARVLQRRLDILGSNFLEHQLHRRGVEIIKNLELVRVKSSKSEARYAVLSSVTELELDDDFSGSSVQFKTNKTRTMTIPVSMVIYGTGVSSSTKLAQDCGLPVGTGIIVNRQMRTADKRIYACGDCVEQRGISPKTWNFALDTGRVAGLNALGYKERYSSMPYPSLVKAFGLFIYNIGETRDTNPGVETLTNYSSRAREYIRLFFEAIKGQMRCVGAVYVGSSDISVSRITRIVMNRMVMQTTIQEIVVNEAKSRSMALSNANSSDQSFNTLREILSSPEELLPRYRAYLESEFTEELLDFYIDIENWRRLEKRDELLSAARTIYETYVEVNSASEINIEFSTRQKIRSGIIALKKKSSAVPRGLFDEAQEEVYRLLSADSLLRFNTMLLMQNTGIKTRSDQSKTYEGAEFFVIKEGEELQEMSKSDSYSNTYTSEED